MSTEHKFVALLSVAVLLGIAVSVVAWSEGQLRTSIVMACVSATGCATLFTLLYKMRGDKETAEKAFQYRLLVIIAQVVMIIGLSLGAVFLTVEMNGQSRLFVVLLGIWVLIFCAGFLYISFSHKNRSQQSGKRD